MKPIALAIVLAIALVPCAYPIASRADTGSRVTITVTDAQTEKPVPLADVSLAGPTALSGSTDREGVVVFDGVKPGQYSGTVLKTGYRPTTIRAFKIEAVSDTTLSITLSKLLKAIGRVAVSRKPRYDAATVTARSPAATSGGTLANSLDDIPGLQVSSGSGNSAFLSIDGHSAAQTAVLADGVPLAPLGSAANIRNLDLDAFDSASASSSGSPTSGGAVDFHVSDPTLAYSYSGNARYASFGNSGTTFFARGTAGFVGYSVGFAGGGSATPLNNAVYLDTSGLSYPHDTGARSTTDVVKLRAPLSTSNVLSGLAILSYSNSSDYCNLIVGLLPCGNGPGNFSTQRLTSFQIKDAAIVGRVSLSATAFVSRVDGTNDQSDLLAFGTPLPSNSSYFSRTAGWDLKAALLGRGLHSLSFSATSYSSSAEGSSQSGMLVAQTPPWTSSYWKAAIADDVYVSNRLTARIEAGENGAGGGAAFYRRIGATWRPNARDTVIGTSSSGVLTPAPNLASGFVAPQFVQFNCATGTVFGTGPSANFDAARDTATSVAYAHRLQNVELTLAVSNEVMENEPLPGYLNGAALPPSSYPADYLADIAQIFSSPLGCGRSRPITFSELALQTYVPGRTVHIVASAGARVALSPSFQIQPYASLTSVYDTTHSTLLYGSTLIPNEQVPGVAPLRFGMAADWKSRNGSVEVVGVYQYTSGNNANALPAYSVTNLGAIGRVQRGEIVASVSNLFNADAPLYGSPDIAEATPRLGASPLTTIAVPLTPRTFQVGYRFDIGAPAKPASDASGGDAGLPTSTSLTALQISSAPPANAFAINANNPACGPEIAALAKPVLDKLAQYVASGKFVEIEDLGSGESARLRTAPNGSSGLLISGTRPVVQTALFSCGLVHAGTAEEVAAHGGYAPTTDDANLYDLIYSSNVGLYMTYDQEKVVKRSVALVPLPASPPNTPFAIKPPSECGPDVRGAATYVLTQLKAYFDALRSKSTPPVLDGVSVVQRSDRPVWYQLRFDDPSIRDAVRSCATIHSGTEKQLQQYGVGGDAPPEMQFAWPIGLYEVDSH